MSNSQIKQKLEAFKLKELQQDQNTLEKKFEESKKKLNQQLTDIHLENERFERLKNDIKKKEEYFANKKTKLNQMQKDKISLINELNILEEKNENLLDEISKQKKSIDLIKNENKVSHIKERLNAFKHIIEKYFILEEFDNYTLEDYCNNSLIKRILLSDHEKELIINQFISDKK